MEIYHALGLHFHQPLGNLELLLRTNEYEAMQIVLCYERAVRYAEMYEDVAKFHIGFSGTLLEQLRSREIAEKFSLNFHEILSEYSKTRNIEFVGMGYYHPVFPLIPPEDWKEQIERWKAIAKQLNISAEGFWPPEMGFRMDMIPVLVETGFKYVVVDGVHVHPSQRQHPQHSQQDSQQHKPHHKPSNERCLIFKPCIAEYEGVEIIVVPRDRDLSNAQQSGCDFKWFEQQAIHRAKECDEQPILITTWTDGENGGWFRQMHEPSGFWSHFFAPYMENVREGASAVIPTKISEFLKEHPPEDEVFVSTGAWNIGSKNGRDFSQWAGTEKQKQVLRRLWEVSRRFHELVDAGEISAEHAEKIYRHILHAETSCNFFWGESWLPNAEKAIKAAEDEMKKIAGRR